MQAKLFVLAPQRMVSEETVRELEMLLEEARAGDLNGLAYTAFHCGGKVSVNAKGRARLVPMFTVGAIDTLKAFVASLVR